MALTCGFIPGCLDKQDQILCRTWQVFVGSNASAVAQMALTCGSSVLDAPPELPIAANFRRGSSVRMPLPTKLGSDLHGYSRTRLGLHQFQPGLTFNSPQSAPPDNYWHGKGEPELLQDRVGRQHVAASEIGL